MSRERTLSTSRLLAGVVSAACMVGLASAAPGEAAGRSSCAPRGARTVLANQQVQLYQRATTLYGCANKGTKPVRITPYLGRKCTQLQGCGPLGPVAIGGRFVTYGFNEYTRQGSEGELYVLDLLKRRRVRVWRGGDLTGTGPTAGVASAVVSPTGRAAWITDTTNVPSGRRVDVHVDRGQGDTIVDTAGPEIDAESLSLGSSGTVYWTHDGEPRATSLR